ncbi:MAG: hypothetical protein ACJAXY_001598 [Nonlabens sp.]|jgi:hypothetical protein|uniref:hypothetical protein n=1 Tax=Nonlabens sp. TaxID=1888209 RepID=UPI0039E43964
MKRLIAFLLFAASCSFAQVHFIIINADTKKPLVHIPERFGEKNIVYSNAQGEINIPEGYEVPETTIGALGFDFYYAKAGDIQNTTISLIFVDYSLFDVLIRGTPEKLKTLR